MVGSAITLGDVSAYISTISLQDDQVDGNTLKNSGEELNEYRLGHARRFWRSVQLVQQWAPPGRPLRVLELGAAPYYFTALLRHYLNCDVTGTSVQAGVWPGAALEIALRRVRLSHGTPAVTEDIPVYVFNVEKDPFPFPAGYFDLVVALEIIEHLAYSPTHTLAEAHRVLKPGGRLVLSTPNAVDMRKTVGLLLNRSVGFPYSGYGIYGRHQREFTARELRLLTEGCGFRVLDIHQENLLVRTRYKLALRLAFGVLTFLSGLPLPYLRDKRETLFMVAESTGHPQRAYPPSLYLFPHLYSS
jgi:SAM-dependent methyltransferase